MKFTGLCFVVLNNTEMNIDVFKLLNLGVLFVESYIR